MTSTAALIPAPEAGYVAFNPETGSASQAESVGAADASLREATGLFLEAAGGDSPVALGNTISS